MYVCVYVCDDLTRKQTDWGRGWGTRVSIFSSPVQWESEFPLDCYVSHVLGQQEMGVFIVHDISSTNVGQDQILIVLPCHRYSQPLLSPNTPLLPSPSAHPYVTFPTTPIPSSHFPHFLPKQTPTQPLRYHLFVPASFHSQGILERQDLAQDVSTCLSLTHSQLHNHTSRISQLTNAVLVGT